ncbi:MAG: L,D-transpeptidase, partial [Lachnospiraceae bacterium]|nr:L,D-transpeptidase [Lachnospiraceae bacterium]
MRRLKKAGLTLLISSVLVSSSVLHTFADQTASSPVITEVIPVGTDSASTEATAEFQESLGPGQFALPPEPVVSPGNPIPEPEISEVPTESTEAAGQPVIIAPDAPSVPEETVQETAQPPMDESGPLSVPKRVPRLQTQILLRDALQWSSPFVNDQPITVEDNSFSSISTYLEGIHGDLLYRTYSTAAGWSDWAMNGQQTDLIDGWPLVEAIQFRFSGPVADQYDLYYTASLSDKSYTSWAKNGMTCGAMNKGIVMTGFRLMFVEKGTDPQLDLSRPVFAAHADGVQYVDGVLRYIHGADGSNYTGWGWVGDDRYYFRDSYPV